MRSDDDSWDISESVGATAVGVAALRAAESRRPDALFHDPYAALLVDAVGPGWSRLLRDGEPIDPELDRKYGPMAAFVTARTVYFDDYFAAAVAAGIRQIVILASGLDARAYRLEWAAGTVIFELDQPKVLQFKAKALAGERPGAQLREVAVDLRQDWPKILRDSGFDPAAPTAWLAEGLLRYLPAEAQDRLFDNIAALSAPGSRIALNTGRGARPLTADGDAQEPVSAIPDQVERLWYSMEDRSDPRDWFAEHGWTVSDRPAADVLAGRGREVHDTALPELDRHILMTAIRPRGDDTQ
ncbi:class I SAM-dependent methyltransferase [Nocardia sp. CDC159]|uniref:S-adenosyl-L-methionine-dependent methyltransferase n=1 Tax=Nocardia pulmonis TaxID=2951408 RepID=A0A9X2ECP8_9NOCA|nr:MULTISPECIES: class I SAM-dependent methyltransferase [Nocardia]MCM6778337.1 class I SAM-dependent methyltransferase [Nocardia pulmonis]MCM6791267.1 class I SAM-dependent methyltransferase [Nocardia sp. CDC159]